MDEGWSRFTRVLRQTTIRGIIRSPGGYAGSMQHRTAERGNTILIAMVLVLGMSVMSLGLAKYAQRYVQNGADLKYSGYLGTQALYAAEMGVNYLMFFNNTTNAGAKRVAFETPLEPFTTDLGNFPMTNSTVYTTPAKTVTQTVTFQIAPDPADPGNSLKRRVTGRVSLPAADAPPGWPNPVTRSIDIRVTDSGSHWTIDRYVQR